MQVIDKAVAQRSLLNRKFGWSIRRHRVNHRDL